MEMEMPGERRVGIDKLAKSGFFKTDDAPGTDTYDDGMNEKGEVVMPGSTSTEAGGIYMEDKGPQDLVRRSGDDLARAREGGLQVSEPAEIEDEQGSIYAGDDDAAKWLKQHDPKYKGDEGLREAA